MQDLAQRPGAIRAYYEGLAAGTFLGSACGACGRVSFPPTTCCEHCGSWDVQPRELSGRATLLFASHNIAPACHPRFAAIAPYVYGHLRLQEGPIVQAIVLGVLPTPEDLQRLFDRGPVPVRAEVLRMDDLPVLAFRVAA
ncbi:Zn-ribbon domain-containing OB-fold protein [Thiomonas sp.]|jgi:uncharacterized OB-fold protein|uniref:Zn-ribbon domain-containing OB-fold protein n=1 Tax=Thiomonas sp. TaxID=2047785 RepID=UPI00260725F1|nr:zinc ribbon domain-containing protein [Thiomonas sp.]